MKHQKTAATPNGSGFARIQRHGSPQNNYPALLGWLTGLSVILLVVLFASTADVKAAESDRVEIGEISAFGGDCEVKHATAGIGTGVQIGAAIYVGDLIRTEENGTIEIALGINGRIRLGGGTSVRITNIYFKNKVVDGLNRQTKRIELSLRYGEVRLRVRENLVTPAPITVLASNLKVDLPRSDVIILRPKEDNTSRKKNILLALAWGRAVLNARVSGEKEWNPEIDLKVNAAGEISVPLEPAADYILKWKRDKSYEKARKAVDELPFSTDLIKDAPKDIPVQSPQMRGAWLKTEKNSRG